MRVTLPCVMCAALFRPFRTAYRHVLASSTAYRLKTKQPFWEFHLHKEDRMTVCCVHMYNHSRTRYIGCLLVRFPSFQYPQINVYIKKMLK